MNNEKKERIVEAIRAYLSIKNLSQNKLSTELGFISGPQLSNVMNPEMWHKISEEMWQKLGAKFLSGDWPTYDIYNLRAIRKICQDMKALSEVTAIAEPTGSGKTVAADAFTKKNPNTFHLVCNQLMTKKDLVRELQKLLGIYTEGRLIEMQKDITDALLKMTKPLIIVDEADKLADQNLLLLKIIFDETKGNCGWLVMGTDVLRDRIEKNSRRNKLGFKELRRRFFNNWKKLRKFDTKDTVIQEEIRFMCADQFITNPEQVDYILKNAENYDDCEKMIKAMNRINVKAAEKETANAGQQQELDMVAA
jgi:DNA transposition AAA+ family ATPase